MPSGGAAVQRAPGAMKILLVSYYFAPANAMGALRTSRLASFLMRRGHDVRVLAAGDPGPPPTLDCDFPNERVLRTPQLDINWLPRRLATLRNTLRSAPTDVFEASSACAASGDSPVRRGTGLLRRASMLYTNALNWPDARAGWLPYAWRAGQQLLRAWRPDLIYASSPPPTCLLLGKLLSARCGAPWVAEFRDRWSDDPYYARPSWRQALEARLEGRTVASARAVVTVSEPWAKHYAEAYGKPAFVVLNGFDPEDYARRESAGAVDSPFLEIVYTGGIYPGRRDPTPLFQAIARSPELRSAVRVQFYGTSGEHARPLAAAAGVQDQVIVHPHVPRAGVAAIQQRADVLLLMQWNDPREQGNLPGKLFEYLGARRPILGLGLEDGVPATIIRERSAGCFTNDPEQIAAQLAIWLDTKRRLGHLPPLPPAAASGFTRTEQFTKLEQFLRLATCDT
jgi:Glycosyl transferase 4-like domain/Glycosyl transferases group 1